MDNIFISYSRSDKKFVDRLIGQLEAAGHPAWVDREDIRGGHLWHEEIVQALETCPAFILVLSPNSVASDNVRRELDLALENKMLILPLMIKPTELSDAMKYQLAGLQYIDMYSDYQAGFESLMNSLDVKGIMPQGVTSPLPSRPHPSSSFLQRNRSKLFGGGMFILIILAALIFVPPLIEQGNQSPPGKTPVAVLPTATEKSCLKLSFVADVSVPDGSIMQPGQRFTKIWRLQNMGTCAWDENFKMVFTGGSRLSELDNVSIPAEVQPGQSVEIAVPMFAPQASGAYRSEWMLRSPEGESVGASASRPFWAQIIVEAVVPTPTETVHPTVTPVPSVANTPQATPTSMPRIYQIHFCNKPCDEPGAKTVTSYPERTKYVYLAWDYENYYLGMPYTRKWSNRGEEWIRYDCVWQGPSAGTFSTKLYDTGGLRSGTWIMQFFIAGKLAAEAHVEIEGNFNYWAPAGNRPCKDF